MTLSEMVGAEIEARGHTGGRVWAYAYGFSKQECDIAKAELPCEELIPYPHSEKRVLITRVSYS